MLQVFSLIYFVNSAVDTENKMKRKNFLTLTQLFLSKILMEKKIKSLLNYQLLTILNANQTLCLASFLPHALDELRKKI